jgi:hypothetical protein
MGYGADMYGMGLDSQSPTIEVVRKYNALRITPRTDLAETSDLLFWAHDDTVVPGKTYRYRLRLGVLNPVAGTNYLADEFQVFRNKVLLWSEPSEVSAPVLIPARTYFFASSFRENTQTMYVTVAKYLLGYWWAETFDVNPGETIGRVVENRKEIGQDNAMMTQGMDPYSMGMVAQEVTTEPKEIDYRTDAVFLGVSKTDAWSGGNRLHEQILYRMLYTLDGSEITYAPVSSTSWDDSLRSAYADIMRQKNREKEDFKAFSTPTSDMGMDPYGYGGEMGGFGG